MASKSINFNISGFLLTELNRHGRLTSVIDMADRAAFLGVSFSLVEENYTPGQIVG